MCIKCDKYRKDEMCLELGFTGVNVGIMVDAFMIDAWMIDGKLQVGIVFGEWNAQTLDIPIKYCPFCGKELPPVEEEE